MERWQELFWDETAASSVEYAILASGIAAAIVAAVTLLGEAVAGLYTKFNLN